MLLERIANGSCQRNCAFHIWYAKTMSSLCGAKLIQQHERPSVSRLTSLLNRNLEIYRFTVLSQMPKKSEASAIEW